MKISQINNEEIESTFEPQKIRVWKPVATDLDRGLHTYTIEFPFEKDIIYCDRFECKACYCYTVISITNPVYSSIILV